MAPDITMHRPHTIIGFAHGNVMNMGVTLAVYASLCKAQNLPFVFPGLKRAMEFSHGSYGRSAVSCELALGRERFEKLE